MLRISLFGGSFNPLTIGHISIAKYLLEKDLADQVWLFPCYISGYGKQMENFDDRVNMCKLATKDEPNIYVKDVEKYINHDGMTDITLERMFDMYEGLDIDFSFVIGADNAINLPKFHNWNKLNNMIKFIVIPRSGYEIDDKSWCHNKPHIYLNDYKPNIISSTIVRDDIKKNNYSKYLPKIINDYIAEKKLFK